MNYQQIMNDFIIEYPDYKCDVINFTEYLETQWGDSLSGESLRIILKGIDVEFILQSLIYNVEDIKRYKSKTKAKRYSTAVGVFFDYIRRNTDIANVELYDAISFNRLRENSYMKRMMAYIEKCELLAGIAEQEPLTLMQAEKVLTWSNEQLEGEGWGEVTAFKKAMAAVGIKMMMLYGITYRELRKIKWEHYDDQYGFITVNDFALRLPPKLSRQLQKMKQFIFQNSAKSKEDLLFIDGNSEPWGEITSSSGIPDYLGTLIETTSVTSIVKYGIGQLLKAGLSDTAIKKITGASDTLIQGCLLTEDDELTRIINNKIVMAELYYEF